MNDYKKNFCEYWHVWVYVMLISLIVDIIKKFNSVTQQDWSLLPWAMPKG